MKSNFMLYEECLQSTHFDLESWGIALVGLIAAVVFKRLGRSFSAIVVAVVGLLLALFWAYLFYQLNCLELFGL